jgi:Xaa-Pro aminopeptidase
MDEVHPTVPAVAEAAADAASRLAALRAELAARGLDGFVVPHADAFQNEYLPPHDERLAWLTGFDGSAGTAIVLAGRAAIFVDGRYTLQVRAQADPALWEFRHLTEQPSAEWLAEALPAGARLGYDPWLHTPSQVERLRAACERAGAEPVATDGNPIDAVWAGQPPPPAAPVVPHEMRFAGRASADKRADVAASLKDGAASLVLTQPDSIAWLLNVRGGDVARTPLPLSFAVLHVDATVDWCVDPAKRSTALAAHLGNAVTLHPMDAFGDLLDALGARGAGVQVSPETSAAWVVERLTDAGAELVRAADPVTAMKARKNPVEIAGSRAAHARDGAALARFLAWLDRETAVRPVGEIEAAERLASLRAEGTHFRDLSFDTISGSGSHGAIVHYRVTPQSDRKLQPGELYLVDSGAQYLDGTTDVTRTVAIGAPGDEMRERFTLVLKGHIAIATARFPAGTTGAQLDTLARQFLWRAGLDYDHGTGHGVGSYLGVHEGPQRISKLGTGAALEPGMIVSNEPGYYKTGEYGIRIENLVAVVEAPPVAGGEKALLEFETLTLAPIDRRLVATSLLTGDERTWLDAYHARVRATIGPRLDAATRAWLEQATAAV